MGTLVNFGKDTIHYKTKQTSKLLPFRNTLVTRKHLGKLLANSKVSTMLSKSCKRIFPNLYQPLYHSQLYQSAAQPQLTRETRYDPSPNPFIIDQSTNSRKRDVIIIGAGHNGLTAASYLAKAGLDVLVLERRDKIGGAAITEEIFPGFKFSRASFRISQSGI